MTALSARVADALRGRILTGELAPGSRLPSEAHLIREHAVSRAVVREALERLRAEGLVRSVRGSGSYVLTAPRDPGASAASARSGQYAPADQAALLEFRGALEAETAALAARRRTAEDLEELEAARDLVGAEGTTAADSLQADVAFHGLIARASRNPYLYAALRDLGPTMVPMPPARIAGGREHAARVDAEHAAILAAIREEDPVAAAAAMRAHLSASRRRLQGPDASGPDDR